MLNILAVRHTKPSSRFVDKIERLETKIESEIGKLNVDIQRGFSHMRMDLRELSARLKVDIEKQFATFHVRCFFGVSYISYTICRF